MLYNFISSQYYDVDLNRMFSALEKGSLAISDQSCLDSLFSEWERVLRILYERTTTPLRYDVPAFLDGQIFQKEWSFNGVRLFFHFDIAFLKKHVSQFSPVAIPIKHFIDGIIGYDPIAEEDLILQRQSNTPIFLVPLMQGKQRGIVVDGNHRLSCAIKKDLPSIDTIQFDVLCAAESFLNRFEQALYVFMFELQEYAVGGTTRFREGSNVCLFYDFI